MSKIVAKIPVLIKSLTDYSKPKLATFVHYAKVELMPPTPGELGGAAKGVNKILTSVRTGSCAQLTVKEAWLNTLVAVEVACWFFIGECIGKRSFVGYKV